MDSPIDLEQLLVAVERISSTILGRCGLVWTLLEYCQSGEICNFPTWFVIGLVLV